MKVRDGEVQLNCQDASLLPARQELLSEPQPRRVIIDINQSDDAQKDIERLQKIMNILKNYPGRDKVSLTVLGDDGMTNLEIPDTTINYCPGLARELTEIVGESNLRLEP